MTGTEWDVLGVGENSVDDMLYLASSLTDARAASSKVQVLRRARWPGGQVATTLSTCAAFGLRTAYAGVFGDDENGRFIRQEMERHGIDTSCAVVRPVPNRSATILVPENGERVVLWQRDPALTLRPGQIPTSLLARTRVVHVDNVDEEAGLWTARAAREVGTAATCDIDVVTGATEALLATVTVGILAEHVPQALTGEADVEGALRALRQRCGAAHPILCVTLGPRGAALLQNDRFHVAPGVAVQVVDTTGAGDVFRGAFIASWLRGDPPATVLALANTAAALSCTKPGAMPSVPTLADVQSAVHV